MSRSNKEDRGGKRRYASVDKFVESQATGYTATYLKVPKGMSLFSAEKGLMLLDILPYEVGKGNPFADKGMLYFERTYFVHRNIGPSQSTYVCPAKTANKPCPICEEAQKLRANADDKEEEDTAKQMFPKQRQLFNVIDLNEGKKGVQLWDMSYHNFGKKLQVELEALDEDERDRKLFFTADAGYSLKVSFGEESMGSGKFLTAETIKFRPRKEQYDEEEILEQVANLDEALIILPYEELKDLLHTAKEDDEEAEDDDESDEDSDDEDDEDEPAPKKKGKKKPEPEDDDDGDSGDDDDSDEGDDSDDSEDEPAPKKKKKGVGFKDVDKAIKKKSKSDEDEEEEEDDEESDDEDDDEQETPKGGKFRTASEKDVKRAKKNAAKKSKSDDDEDDDDDEEEEDSDSDDDDDPDLDDFDSDDEDEEEEDEPAPKKKKK